MTEKSERLRRPLPHHTRRSQGAARTLPGAGSSKIAAGLAHTRRRRLSFSPFPRPMCPGFPGVGLLGSGHAMGWLEVRDQSGVSMPRDERQPRRFRRDRSRRAGWGSVHGAFAGPPRGLPAGQASRIHRGPGQAGRHTGRAGRPATENLAASPRRSRCACGYCPAPGEPLDGRSASVTGIPGSGRAHAPGRGVRSSRTRWPSRGSSSCRAVSQPHGFQPPRVP
jgi:hypothetical protein